MAVKSTTSSLGICLARLVVVDVADIQCYILVISRCMFTIWSGYNPDLADFGNLGMRMRQTDKC